MRVFLLFINFVHRLHERVFAENIIGKRSRRVSSVRFEVHVFDDIAFFGDRRDAFFDNRLEHAHFALGKVDILSERGLFRLDEISLRRLQDLVGDGFLLVHEISVDAETFKRFGERSDRRISFNGIRRQRAQHRPSARRRVDAVLRFRFLHDRLRHRRYFDESEVIQHVQPFVRRNGETVAHRRVPFGERMVSVQFADILRDRPYGVVYAIIVKRRPERAVTAASVVSYPHGVVEDLGVVFKHLFGIDAVHRRAKESRFVLGKRRPFLFVAIRSDGVFSRLLRHSLIDRFVIEFKLDGKGNVYAVEIEFVEPNDFGRFRRIDFQVAESDHGNGNIRACRFARRADRRLLFDLRPQHVHCRAVSGVRRHARAPLLQIRVHHDFFFVRSRSVNVSPHLGVHYGIKGFFLNVELRRKFVSFFAAQHAFRADHVVVVRRFVDLVRADRARRRYVARTVFVDKVLPYGVNIRFARLRAARLSPRFVRFGNRLENGVNDEDSVVLVVSVVRLQSCVLPFDVQSLQNRIEQRAGKRALVFARKRFACGNVVCEFFVRAHHRRHRLVRRVRHFSLIRRVLRCDRRARRSGEGRGNFSVFVEQVVPHKRSDQSVEHAVFRFVIIRYEREQVARPGEKVSADHTVEARRQIFKRIVDLSVAVHVVRFVPQQFGHERDIGGRAVRVFLRECVFSRDGERVRRARRRFANRSHRPCGKRFVVLVVIHERVLSEHCRNVRKHRRDRIVEIIADRVFALDGRRRAERSVQHDKQHVEVLTVAAYADIAAHNVRFAFITVRRRVEIASARFRVRKEPCSRRPLGRNLQEEVPIFVEILPPCDFIFGVNARARFFKLEERFLRQSKGRRVVRIDIVHGHFPFRRVQNVVVVRHDVIGVSVVFFHDRRVAVVFFMPRSVRLIDVFARFARFRLRKRVVRNTHVRYGTLQETDVDADTLSARLRYGIAPYGHGKTQRERILRVGIVQFMPLVAVLYGRSRKHRRAVVVRQIVRYVRKVVRFAVVEYNAHSRREDERSVIPVRVVVRVDDDGVEFLVLPRRPFSGNDHQRFVVRNGRYARKFHRRKHEIQFEPLRPLYFFVSARNVIAVELVRRDERSLFARSRVENIFGESRVFGKVPYHVVTVVLAPFVISAHGDHFHDGGHGVFVEHESLRAVRLFRVFRQERVAVAYDDLAVFDIVQRTSRRSVVVRRVRVLSSELDDVTERLFVVVHYVFHIGQ